ncbi:hypothetical protein [Anaerocolumna sp. MB42-C2]|uniref:hypothetical protein n=1 Tax=Anaerocolumna sp. MB42-C2 TaxID=3070997 RepID=UPI0027E07F80|nr:hypothetical protein [Anaerocolumna sp. MB42-C2]WMJ90208.1 hypothetical protein RBU59_11975 [Anaerocolumna sp. MB42-C2]
MEGVSDYLSTIGVGFIYECGDMERAKKYYNKYAKHKKEGLYSQIRILYTAGESQRSFANLLGIWCFGGAASA